MSEHFFSLLRQKYTDAPKSVMLRRKRLGIWETITWEYAYLRVSALAAGLVEKQIDPGARVAVVGYNSPEVLFAILAVQAVHGVAAVIDGDLRGQILNTYLSSARVRYAIVEDVYQINAIVDALPERCSLEWLACWREGTSLSRRDGLRVLSVDSLMDSGEQWMSEHRDFFANPARVYADVDIAMCCFTAGIQNDAKAVCLSYRALVHSVQFFKHTDLYTDQDEFLWFGNLNNLPSLLYALVAPLLCGIKINCPENRDTVLQNMEEVQPSVLFAAADVLTGVASAINSDLTKSYKWLKKLAESCYADSLKSSTSWLRQLLGNLLFFGPLKDRCGFGRLRVIRSFGSMLPQSTAVFFSRMQLEVKQCYGCVETAGCISLQAHYYSDPMNKGLPIHNSSVQRAENGEILFRGENLAKSYSKEGGDVKLLDEDGWFHTGNSGHINEDGSISLNGTLILSTQGDREYNPTRIQHTLSDSLFIHSVFVTMDERGCIMAFIDLFQDAVGQWARRLGLDFSSAGELVSLPEVVSMVRERIMAANQKIPDVGLGIREKIQKFVLLEKHLLLASGEMSHNGTLRRGILYKQFKPVVEASGRCETQAVFLNGFLAKKILCRIQLV